MRALRQRVVSGGRARRDALAQLNNHNLAELALVIHAVDANTNAACGLTGMIVLSLGWSDIGSTYLCDRCRHVAGPLASGPT